jgi:hypothetical protein
VRICDDTCTVAMVAGSSACFCAHCGAVCEGQFNGCESVWASGRNGDGVVVDIRVAGPVIDAQCLSPQPDTNGSTAAAMRATSAAYTGNGLLGDVKGLVERMEAMQVQVDRLVGGLGRGLSALAEQEKALDQRLAQLEATLLELRASMAHIIG